MSTEGKSIKNTGDKSEYMEKYKRKAVVVDVKCPCGINGMVKQEVLASG